VLEAEPGVRLLVRASWQPDPQTATTLVLVHGLGGSSEGSYSLSTGRLAFARGFNVARMNMRGAGAGGALGPLLYNAGLDRDLLTVVRWAAARSRRVALAGFSLGSNLCLLLAGRLRDELPPGLIALAAVSPPVDLAACAAALDAPGNRLYRLHYLAQLRATYRQRQRAHPALFAAGLEQGVSSIRAYDDRITAPYGGFSSADDYYSRSSAGPWLARIGLPTLVLAASDDPLIPAASVARWALPESGCVHLELSPTGGHVGFVARSRAPGWFWAADRSVAFLEGCG
jgi:predicted alpha/beta-fold hydrolase